MSEERVYDDRQAAAILARAVELGRKASGAEIAEKAGATLGELEKIAAEAGIAPELVREAASELSASPRSGAARALLGGEVTRKVSFSVEGVADGATLQRALLELPRIAGSGMGLCSPEGLTWSTDAAASQRSGVQLSVDVRIAGGRSDVEIVDKRGGMAGGLFGGIVGGVGFGMGVPLTFALGVEALGMGLWSAVFLIGSFAISWLACRLGFSAFARAREKKLGKVRAELKRILERK